MARDYKLNNPKSTQIDPAQMDKLLRSGWTTESVGARFGIKPRLVQRRVREWKLSLDAAQSGSDSNTAA